MKEKILYSKIIEGTQKHLLIFHGLFGQSDNWNTLGKQFAQKFTVHLIDLRNHGHSFHDSDMSFEAMAKDINDYMNYHNISSTSLIGHSLGGRAVMEFAFSYPNKIEKLIVADMAPKAYPPHHQSIIKALNMVDFNTITKRSEVDDVLKQYIPQIGVRQFLLKNVYHHNKKYAFRFNLEALTNTYEDMVSSNLSNEVFNGDTLFLKGEKSDYITPLDEPLIKQKFPNARIETISNAGHWLHAENPNEFLQKTLTFLA